MSEEGNKGIIGNLLSDMTEAFSGVSNVVSDLAGKDTVKSATSLGKMFKGMAGSSVHGIALKMIFELLSPFIKIVKLFLPIIKLIGNIVEKALMPLMVALMPIIMMIVDLLMQFSPIIEEIIGVCLQPLIMFLNMFMSMMTENQAMFDEIFNAISMIVGVIAQVLGELFKSEAIMIVMKAAIMGLMYVLKGIVFVINIIITIVKIVVNVIMFLVNAFMKLTGWIKSIVDFLLLFIGVEIKSKKGSGHQAGAIFSTETLARVGEGGQPEILAPLDILYGKFDELRMATEVRNDSLKALVRRNVIKDREAIEVF